MPGTILITRPQASSEAFAKALGDILGKEARIVVSPVMRVEIVRDKLPLGQARTLIFTSSHAVRAFVQLSEERDFICYTVGEGTSATARDAGFRVIEGGGTAERLYKRLISDRPPGPYLYMRGNHVARELSELLNSAGLETYEHVIYQQIPCPLNPPALSCLEGGNPVIVPLFSPRSARLFFELSPNTSLIWVAAMSDNVADAVPRSDVNRLEVAVSPTLDAMLHLTAELFVAANQLEGDGASQ